MSLSASLEGRDFVTRDSKGETLTCTVSSNPESAKLVRNAVACFLAKHYRRSAAFRELMIAVGEAIANAVEHGSSAQDISITVTVTGCIAEVSVQDYGPGFAPHTAKVEGFPPPESERGRGFPLISACTDSFHIETHLGRGTLLEFSRRLC